MSSFAATWNALTLKVVLSPANLIRNTANEGK